MAFGLDELFGGSKQEQTVVDSTPRQLKELLDPFSNAFKGLLSGGKKNPLGGIPTSPQSKSGYSAPMTAAEQQALAQIAAQTGPNTARSQLLDRTMAGEFTAAGNPFTQAAIEAAQRPTLQALEDTLGRTLPGQFARAGHSVQPGGSSPFDMAAARSYEAGANALADIAARISFESHEAERGRQQQAITFSQAEVDKSLQNLQAQALPRMIEQYGIDQGLKEFQTRTTALIQLLGLLSGGQLNQTQVVGQQQESPSIFKQLFPGGLTASGTVTS